MKPILAALAFFAFMTLAVSCEIARYGECRTVHPVWYCVTVPSR